LIALTGLLLNHSDDLGLPQGYLSNELAKHLYGIEAPPVEAAFNAGDAFIASAANSVYFNETPIAADAGMVRGVVSSNNIVVIATDQEFVLTTVAGSLIERMAIAMAQPPERIGTIDSRIIVESGNAHFELDPGQMMLSPLKSVAENVTWSETMPLNNEQQQRLGAAATGQVITWERVLVDLHSGRILPYAGRYLFDLTALCLLYLCMSGVFLWFRRR